MTFQKYDKIIGVIRHITASKPAIILTIAETDFSDFQTDMETYKQTKLKLLLTRICGWRPLLFLACFDNM